MRVHEVHAAPFWRRLLADLVDLALLAAATYTLWRVGVVRPPALPPIQYDWVDYTADLLANHLSQLGPVMVVIPTLGFLYGTILHTLVGRTLGELLLGLRLIAPDGDTAGPVRSLLHCIGTLIGLALLLLGYIWAGVDIRRQGLAEYLSGTLLIVGRPS